MNERKTVVIVGAGFGGVFTARRLAQADVNVLLIDRNNYHTFTPLIYQVATAGLDVEDVAYPVRKIFADKPNVNFMLGEITGISHSSHEVIVKTNGKSHRISYDYLVIAAGSITNFYGNAEIEQHSFGLKTMQDAVLLRNHILTLFEKAEWTDDLEQIKALTTMVVVGGGATGIETAGALHELYDKVLRHEYHQLQGVQARVILIEATDTLLRPYPQSLRESALEQLQSLGVEVILERTISHASATEIELSDGTIIPTRTLIWATGVRANPLAELLGVELARGGRIPVEKSMQVMGIDDVFAIGDIAYLEDENGNPYPQLIPVAQQQAELLAANIINRLNGKPDEHFTYYDKGTMATIGRRRAVAWVFNKIELSGFLAWVSWLGLHLLTLMGFRNRISVFVNWVWNYLTYDRAARVILNPPDTDNKETGAAT